MDSPIVGGGGRMLANAALAHGSRAAARAGVTRKDFTDRLGLPADATNAQVLAAADRALAARPSPSPEDRLYEAAWGTAGPEDDRPAARAARPAPRAARPAARQFSIDAIYALAWPGDSGHVDGLDCYPVSGGTR